MYFFKYIFFTNQKKTVVVCCGICKWMYVCVTSYFFISFFRERLINKYIFIYIFCSCNYLLLVDAIGRYSDRLGPRPKMRSVAYRRMRCVYATGGTNSDEVVCKIISHTQNPHTHTSRYSKNTHISLLILQLYNNNNNINKNVHGDVSASYL